MHIGLRDFVASYFQHMICCLWVCFCVAPDSHKIILKGQHECKHVTYARVDCVVQTAAILIPAFQQLNGINSITFYAPQLFASIGAGLTGTYGALLSSVVIDAIEMAGTFIGLGTVDK